MLGQGAAVVSYILNELDKCELLVDSNSKWKIKYIFSSRIGHFSPSLQLVVVI